MQRQPFSVVPVVLLLKVGSEQCVVLGKYLPEETLKNEVAFTVEEPKPAKHLILDQPVAPMASAIDESLGKMRPTVTREEPPGEVSRLVAFRFPTLISQVPQLREHIEILLHRPTNTGQIGNVVNIVGEELPKD